MKKRLFVVAAVLISSQLLAQEQDSIVVDHIEFPSAAVELSRVTITTNKYPRKVSETGKVVSIITRAMLDRSSGKTLGEILNTISGTTILGANNNAGTNLTASIRGSSAGNVLVLIDGIPVSDPSVNNNYFDLNFISPDQVERIEVLRGGQSVLYGSDAVAGVINIITKKGGPKRHGFTAGLSGGTYGTFKQNIGVDGADNAFNYSANYSHLGSKGFSAVTDQAGNKNFDKDGIDQHTFMTRFGFKINKRLQAYISGMYNYYKTDIDASAFNDEKDYTVTNKDAQPGMGLTYAHKTGSFHFNYSFIYIERDYVDDSVSKGSPYLDYSHNNFIGRTHFAEIYNNWKWSRWELLTGIDNRYQNTLQSTLFVFPPSMFGPGYTSTGYMKGKMNQFAPYATLVFKSGTGFNTEIGGRLNIHSEYGSNFTFSINPSYLIQHRVKLFGNLYTSFKSPTLYQLFDPSAGNKDLKPEKGIIGEVGTDVVVVSALRLRAIGFYRNTKNAIQYIYIDPINYIAQYKNLSHQENYGFEFEANFRRGKVTGNLNYTYTDGKTKSAYDGTGAPVGKDTTYYNLYRIPKSAFNFDIGVQATTKLFISAQLHAISKRSEFIYGLTPETLKGYALIDLYSEYWIHRKIKAFINLKNITDKKYIDWKGFNTRRFNFMAGINFQL